MIFFGACILQQCTNNVSDL